MHHEVGNTNALFQFLVVRRVSEHERDSRMEHGLANKRVASRESRVRMSLGASESVDVKYPPDP